MPRIPCASRESFALVLAALDDFHNWVIREAA